MPYRNCVRSRLKREILVVSLRTVSTPRKKLCSKERIRRSRKTNNTLVCGGNIAMSDSGSDSHGDKDRKTQKNKKGVVAILFDVDGTLTHSDPIHFDVFKDLLIEHGVNSGKPIDHEFFKAYISGRSNASITKDLFPQWEEEKRQEFSQMKEKMYRERAKSQLKKMKGLQNLLNWCKPATSSCEEHMQCAAVTNAPRLNAELMLSVLGLDNFFDVLIIGDECSRAKPYPDPYVKALNHLGCSNENAIVIEDSKTGIQAAINASIPAIGITTTLSSEQLLDCGAFMTIDDYDDEGLWTLLKEGERPLPIEDKSLRAPCIQ